VACGNGPAQRQRHKPQDARVLVHPSPRSKVQESSFLLHHDSCNAKNRPRHRPSLCVWLYTCAPSPVRFRVPLLCPSRSAHPPSPPRAAYTPAGLPLIPRAASSKLPRVIALAVRVLVHLCALPRALSCALAVLLTIRSFPLPSPRAHSPHLQDSRLIPRGVKESTSRYLPLTRRALCEGAVTAQRPRLLIACPCAS